MPIKRKTINLAVISNALVATDAASGLKTTDAGLQGEDGAVWLYVEIPSDWSDLCVRLQVMASNGECDESGLPQAGVINMALRSSVTVPGGLTVTLTGTGADGVRRTAQCDSLYIAAQDCPADAVSQVYPLAFENLCDEVANNVVHTITGSGGAKVAKTGGAAYNIDVSGTGGDMLKANYVSGQGASNANAVDHAAYADKTGSVDRAANADTADVATNAENAKSGSALESAINAKQNALTAGGDGGIDLLSGTTVKSLKGSGIKLIADDSSILMGLDGSLVMTGMIMYFAQDLLPTGWTYADGSMVSIAGYRNLYNVIGSKYGKGPISYISVVPTYYTDNANVADDITLQKYASGIQQTGFFATDGTVFTGGSFRITAAGSYTFYCKDSSGREAVQYIYIPGLSAPYLLNTSSSPITSDLALTVFENTVDETSTVNSVKVAAGIQTVSYFSGSGTAIGTSDNTEYTFQDGTKWPGGIYTFYTKDAAQNEAVQYFNVVSSQTLAISLSISFGSDSFNLPNLTGTVDKRLSACIKL